MAIGEIKRNSKKMIRAGLRSWSRQRRMDIRVAVNRTVVDERTSSGLPHKYKGWAGTYVARACVGKVWKPRTKNTKCAVGGGRTPTRAVKTALAQLAKKIK